MRDPPPEPSGDSADAGLYGSGGDDYSDKLYALPDVGPPPPGPPPTSAPPPGAPSGPGEYTRIIQGLSVPVEPAPASEPPPPPPVEDDEAPPSTKWLVVALAVIVLAAIAVAVVLVLMNRPDPTV
ncbi:MAG: hypothetical protein KJP18_11980 [Gemmatimonadetes bacterium]|nr:hypothetical protein [Gemmatimonadota bacterium]